MINRNWIIFILFITLAWLFNVCNEKKPSKMSELNKGYWQEATSDAGFSKRFGHQLVVFNNRMWLVGGQDSTGLKNDIWYSADGFHWKEAVSSDHPEDDQGYSFTAPVANSRR